MKLNLVTVVGNNITMLPHMIKHYQNMVDDYLYQISGDADSDITNKLYYGFDKIRMY